jgi:polar amino acid transport system ATP-binding protein
MSTHRLVLESIEKSFGARSVLSGINLEVAEGEVVCLIGASGSGKSTLLRCCNLLEPIDSGAVYLDGVDISEPGLDPDPHRQRIGMVFQSFNLFPHMSVLDNVAAGPRHVLGATRTESRERAGELLERFGLGDHARSYPDQLSGGQQQRVAIARSMAVSPDVLLLDEITSALDPELVGEVLDVVRHLKSQGMTMLIATHEMAFAREIADTVCFLHEGVILESGTPEVIFGSPSAERTKAFLRRVIDAGRM